MPADADALQRCLFFSHSGVDTGEARKLAQRLRDAPATKAQQLRVWFDKDDLRVGEPWQPQIEDAIRRSSAFAVYIGSRGIANWVDAEVRVALNRAVTDKGYPFIPILSPDAPGPEALPGFVQQFQAVRVRAEEAEWFEKLIVAVLGEHGLPLEENPFFGLLAVDESRSHLFFGREREIQELLAKLARTRLVLVVGDSGSGKSSLVRAGLVPKFRGGALALLDDRRPEDETWHVVVTRPLADPFQSLSEAVYEAGRPLQLTAQDRGTFAKWAKSGDPTRTARALRSDLPLERTEVLFIVDQFEELWTNTSISRDERERFVELLLALSGSDEHRVRVVLTMRQDYTNLCSEIEPLAERLEANERRARFELGRMADVSLRRVVTEPLLLARIATDVRETLADHVTRDVGQRAGDLALVQMALTEAWNARASYGGDLQRSYVRVGRVEGALAKAAEKVRSDRNDEEREHIDAIMIRLVRLGDTAGATRRVATKDEFDEDRWKQVQYLASDEGKRLVQLGGGDNCPTVEIGHEALVTAWPHLQATLQHSAPYKRDFDALILKAKAWAEERADDKHRRLAVGAELEAFERVRNERTSWLSSRERGYLAESVEAVAREERRARRIVFALGSLAIMAVMLGLIAGWSAHTSAVTAQRATAAEALARAREQEANRNAATILREQAENDLLNSRPKAALLLSEAYRLDSTDLGIRTLLPRALRGLLATTFTHEGPVRSAAFSRDGERIVTASEDETAKVWEAKSGELLATLEGHAGPVRSAAFSGDGERIVTASEDETAMVWEAKSGELLATLGGPTRPLRSAGFSADGRLILTAGEYETAKVWEARSGKLLATLEDGNGATAVGFSPDGERVVTAYFYRGIPRVGRGAIWEAKSGKLLATLEGHEDSVRSVGFSPDGERVVTASQDRTAKVWEAKSGKLLETLDGHQHLLLSAEFSPDGERVLTASADETAKVWEASSGELTATLEGHAGPVLSARFSADGRCIVTASVDGTSKVWEASSGELLETLRGHAGEVRSAEFSSDGERVVTASHDGTAKMWETTSDKLFENLEGHGGAVKAAGFSYDSERVVTGGSDGTAKVWEAKSGKLVKTLEGHQHEVRSVEFSADGERVVTASWDGTAKVWDVKTGKVLATLAGPRLLYAKFSADGSRVLTASLDQEVKVWEAKSGKIVATLRLEAGEVSAQFGPDGECVVAETEAWIVTIWKVTSGKVLVKLPGHGARVSSVEFSADGERVVTASDDKTARVWDLRSGKLVNMFEGHEKPVRTAKFSADGERVVTASEDRTARVWDTKSGKLTATLQGHAAILRDAVFSADGQRVVTTSMDETARVWDADSGKLLAVLKGGSPRFSPDGQRVVTIGQDGTATVWDVHLETRSPEEIARLVAARVPWKLEGGVLVPR